MGNKKQEIDKLQEELSKLANKKLDLEFKASKELKAKLIETLKKFTKTTGLEMSNIKITAGILEEKYYISVDFKT